MTTLNLSDDLVQVVIATLEAQLKRVVDERNELERDLDRVIDLNHGLVREVGDLKSRIADLIAENDRQDREIMRMRNRIPVADFDWNTIDGLDFIPAIKAFREATDLGLKESKDAVERAFSDGKITFRGGYIPLACK